MHDSYVAPESFSAQSQGQNRGAFKPSPPDKSMGPRVRDSHSAFECFSAKPQGHATNPVAWGAIATESTLDSFSAVDLRVDTLDSICSFGQCSDPEEATN